MNIGNILKVADAIEQASVPDLGFNMGTWIGHSEDKSERSCGTTACIAGWSAIVDKGSIHNVGNDEIVDIAQKFLGMSGNKADELFLYVPYMNPLFAFRDTVGPIEAVRCLRNLAITGEVDWEAAMKPNEPDMPSLPVSAPSEAAKVGA